MNSSTCRTCRRTRDSEEEEDDDQRCRQQREREKSFGDGTKRTKWETIEKKWERERDLGPLLAIQLHHVISRRWDLILVGDMVKIDGFSRSPQSVDILSLSFQLASTPTAAAAEAKGASTIRLIENATINRSFSMTALLLLLLPTWRNIYQRGIVFVEATSVVFSPSKTKTWPRAGRLRSANRLADGAMMASVNHHELARLHPRFKMGRKSFWARHAIIGLIPLSSSVPTAHAYYLGLITYIRSLGEFFFFLILCPCQTAAPFDGPVTLKAIAPSTKGWSRLVWRENRNNHSKSGFRLVEHV